MEAKMIANSVTVRPKIPSILIDATIKTIQAGMRVDEFSKSGDKNQGNERGRSVKKKVENKDDGRLKKRMQLRRDADDDDETTRTYRNFDERRGAFLIVGDQHRFVGKGDENKFIFPTAPPLDFSFCMINKIEEIVTESEQPQTKRNFRFPKKTPDERYKTSSLRLSYNVIDTIEGLINVLYKILDGGPFGLCWLDLSFNTISKIDEDTLSQLPNLKILYLHGNALTDMTEIPNLRCLKNLVALTLHGNPVEEETGYRISVLFYLPWLKHLDFVAVAKSDMANSLEFGEKFEPYWVKRHDELEAIYQSRKKAGEITYTEKVMQGYDPDNDEDVEPQG
ncbi:unnamed protein product [Orchesella dallaii]|uniref:Leucine-rich repeat-containing protein 51 n=1 Tax=Orchesella dallaii TaxID=48710 RepID=A0ABP1PRJ8_9HEXA